MNATSTPNMLVLKELPGNPPTHLDPLQSFFAPYSDTLIHIWVAIWFATALYVLVFAAKEYIAQRKADRK